ncbi:MAG: phosphatidate cytidylyltransferase [Oscillibacter sp.]|nr:phosphatidate cytidylyltransferase [Oscillibacter sp.]
MNSRILVAVVGIPLLILIILWAPDWLICAALCALAALAGFELQKCVSGESRSVMTALSAALPAFTILWGFLTAESPALLWAAEIMLLFAYAISQGGKVKFEQIAAALFAGIPIAYSFASFLRMESGGAPRALLLLPFVLSFSCDSGAYLAGSSFGRHKLAPIVSPHKTVEGAVGGLLGNVLGGLVFAFLFRRFGGGATGYLWVAALSLACGVVSQLGDLSFSLIKRQYGIKDYGRVFFAHGGVLDRFDSVLFVAPVAEFALSWIA